MPKKNPWSLVRPNARPTAKTFTDPDYPGEEWTLTARKLNGCEMMLAIEKAEEQIELFIKQGNAYPQAVPVSLSEGLFRSVYMLEAMQRQENGEPYAPDDFYTVDDLIGIAHLSGALWMDMTEWVGELNKGAEADAGNSPGAGVPSSSAPPSTTTSPTPTESSATTGT